MDPDVPSRLILTRSGKTFDVPALVCLLHGRRPGKRRFEHARRRDKAIRAPAHQEIVVGAIFENARHNARRELNPKVYIVEEVIFGVSWDDARDRAEPGGSKTAARNDG